MSTSKDNALLGSVNWAAFSHFLNNIKNGSRFTSSYGVPLLHAKKSLFFLGFIVARILLLQYVAPL